jgi:DNA mismatch endonuclease (patch repair protein)
MKPAQLIAPTPQRSAMMRAVRSMHTKPERVVRKMLHPFAPGYRLHRRDIPGTPDIAYVGRKLAIFVHGCFWHGHACARGARIPKTNVDYWTAKIARNKARDLEHRAALKREGFKALVIWECELKTPENVERRLRKFIQE